MDYDAPSSPLAVRTTHDIEAELLTSCLVGGPEVLSRCIEARIGPELFEVPTHRAVFERMLSLYHRGVPITVAAIVEDLTLEGIRVLAQVSGRAHMAVEVSRLIEEVREQAALRETLRSVVAVLERCLQRMAH